MERPKYLDQLEAQLQRTADVLLRKESWLTINGGLHGAMLADAVSAAERLERSARALRMRLEYQRDEAWLKRDGVTP